MKRKLVFATNNAHKLEEVAAILGDQIELLSLNDIGCHTDIPETAENCSGYAPHGCGRTFGRYRNRHEG